MVSILQPHQRVLPRSLTHPAGIAFLDPAHRVSREELDRRDRRWRAMRERAYARAWSEDATLVGSVRRFAARSAIIHDWEERTIGRRLGGGGGASADLVRQHTLLEDGSTVFSGAQAGATGASGTPPSISRISTIPAGHTGAARTRLRRFSLRNGNRRPSRKLKEAIRRLVDHVRA